MNQDASNNTNALNGATHSEQDNDPGSDLDSSSSVYSMSSDEIEDHFIENHDRRFYSLPHGRLGPYPFPVDDLERQRLDRMHELVKELLGDSNYRGPVRQTLAARENGQRLRILDIGTGHGRWVEEMAEEFPHTKVYGIDIVPLATRYPADNVQFEVHNINSPTRWAPGRFDLVHVRQMCFSPVNLPVLMREISRILRPQGLFLACDWIPRIFVRNGTSVTPLTSPTTEILDRLRDFAARRRLSCDPSLIPRILTENTTFENVVTEQHFVDLDNTPMGQQAKRSLLDLASASIYCLRDDGLSMPEIEQYAMSLRDGLDNGIGLCLIYLTVHGRKKVVP